MRGVRIRAEPAGLQARCELYEQQTSTRTSRCSGHTSVSLVDTTGLQQVTVYFACSQSRCAVQWGRVPESLKASNGKKLSRAESSQARPSLATAAAQAPQGLGEGRWRGPQEIGKEGRKSKTLPGS